MKRRFMAVLIALVMCLAAFSGCSALKGLERDVQVILQNEGEYVGTYTVNIFNNAVVPEMTKDGYQFRGWSVKDNWTAGVDSEELLSENTGLIRYDDIKDYIGKDSLSITLYAAYSEIPHHDLVIAWYNKETTSGLTQESIDAFQSELYAYLTTQGYTPEQMDIVIRGYSGDVGTTCSEIKKDGDVDIMIGWSSTSNITGTGGMEEGTDFIENNGVSRSEQRSVMPQDLPIPNFAILSIAGSLISTPKQDFRRNRSLSLMPISSSRGTTGIQKVRIPGSRRRSWTALLRRCGSISPRRVMTARR